MTDEEIASKWIASNWDDAPEHYSRDDLTSLVSFVLALPATDLLGVVT